MLIRLNLSVVRLEEFAVFWRGMRSRNDADINSLEFITSVRDLRRISGAELLSMWKRDTGDAL